MAEATQDIQIVLRAIDQASPAIRDVSAALERLGQLNLTGATGQLDALGRGLDALGSQAQLLGERFTAASDVVQAAMAAQTAALEAQLAQQRQVLSQAAQAMTGLAKAQQDAMTAAVVTGQQQQADAVQQGAEKAHKAAADAADKARQAARAAGATEAEAELATLQPFLQAYQTTQQGATQAAQQGASQRVAVAKQEAEQVNRLLGERGLLGGKGPLGGGLELPGVDLAQQFFVWGTVFSLYSQAAQAISSVTRELFTSNAAFEQTQQTLTTLFGGKSSVAGQALAALDQFAETTPFTRDQVRQVGISFLAAGADMMPAVKAAGDLSSAMQNQGGILVAERGIVDAFHGDWRILKDELNLTKEQLVAFNPELEKHGKIIQSQVIPTIEAYVNKNFSGAMARQMDTLAGSLSNLQDVASETVRQAGFGALAQIGQTQAGRGTGPFAVLEQALVPMISNLGDLTQKGSGGVLTSFAQTLGTSLGQALQAGLRDLDAWFTKMGGLEGVLLAVQQAWIAFTSALHTGLSIVLGVSDGIGNALGLVRELASGVERLLAPVQAVFGIFRSGHDSLREVTATLVGLVLELKLLAGVYDLAGGALGRFTGVLAANTAAQEANGAAAGAAAAAQGTAAAGGLLGGARATGGAIYSNLALAGSALTQFQIGEFALARTSFMALTGALAATLTPLGVFIADLYLLPKAFSDITLYIQTLRGIDAQHLQTGLAPLSIPQTYSVPPGPATVSPNPAGLLTPGGFVPPLVTPGTPGVEATGPGAFAAFLQNTFGTEAYRDWYEYTQHQRPGDFITYLQRLPENARAIIGAEYARQGGAGGAGYIAALGQGQAPGLTPDQQANVYTAYNQALARTEQDAAYAYGRQNLPGDVAGQIQSYVPVLRAQTPRRPGESDAAYNARVGARIDQYARQISGQYHVDLPSSFQITQGQVQGPSAAQLAAQAQEAQQQVQYDLVLRDRVPGHGQARFNQDLLAAAKAMSAAGDTADQVTAFSLQQQQAWARASAQATEQTLQAHVAMRAPFGVIQRDMAQLATQLAQEGDSSAQIAAKLGQTVETYFQNLIGQVDAQRQALQTIGAPVGAQLGAVGQHQALMQQENAALVARGLKPKYTPEEIQAAGITGQREVLAPGLQSGLTVAKDAYSAALQQNQVTSLGQIAGYVGPILAAERAQLTNQGTPGAQITAELQLQQLQLTRQGQDAVLTQLKDIFTADLDSKASTAQLHKDETSVLNTLIAEGFGPKSPQYRLAKAQMDQQIAGGAGAGAARPPEPHYGTYGGLTATGAAYGQSVVTYGTQLGHDPWQQVVAGLREQLAFWKSKAQAEQQQLDALRATASNTARTADAVHRLILPPFPTGPASHAALPRASGAHTPIRRP